MERNSFNGDVLCGFGIGHADEDGLEISKEFSKWVIDVTAKANLVRDQLKEKVAKYRNEIDQLKKVKQDLGKKCENYQREIADLTRKNSEKDLMLDIARNLYPNLINIFSRSPTTKQIEKNKPVNNVPPCNSKQPQNNVNSCTTDTDVSTDTVPANLDMNAECELPIIVNVDNLQGEITAFIEERHVMETVENFGDDCGSLKDEESDPDNDGNPRSPKKVCKWITPVDAGTLQPCDHAFNTARRMLAHVRRDHLNETRGAGNTCRWQNCKRGAFRNRISLLHHLRIHTGYKSGRCSHKGCGQIFQYHHNLEAHVNAHKNVKLTCAFPGCCLVFTCQRNLKVHQRRRHKEMCTYACAVRGCGRTFRQARELREHVGNNHKR